MRGLNKNTFCRFIAESVLCLKENQTNTTQYPSIGMKIHNRHINRTPFLAFVVTSFFMVSCHTSSVNAFSSNEQQGTIQLIRQWAVIIPENNQATRFLPQPPLKKTLRQQGLQVIFSGHAEEIPANVRLVGTPFHIDTIRKAD